MRVQEIQSPEIWQEFIKKQDYTLFVQSPQYGEFYKQLGENSCIIGLLEESTLVGGALIVTTHARRGNFLYVPYGPILPEEKREEALQLFSDFIKKYAKEKGYSFVRVSPFLSNSEENKKLFSDAKYRPSPMHMLAETTWLLDITESEEILLKNMNKNHRNLIRRCEREGVQISMTTNQEALKDLSTLLDITASRHKFIRFSQKYILEEFKQFLPDNVALFEARLPDGTLDASAIILFFGNMACYRHSASLGKDSKLPTSYLLQWKVIQEAKKRGMKWYNFWGIAPEGADTSHPFYGITHFKKGFGGNMQDLLRCQDLVVSPKYYFNWLIETFRRRKRGF